MSRTTDEDQEFEVDLESEIDLDAATQEALDAVVRNKDVADDPAVIDPQVEALRAEALTWREQALRARADYENLVRRTEREREDNKRYQLAGALRDLLPIVDNFGRALGATGSIEDLKVGVGLIHRQMVDYLRAAGVRPIESAGQVFNPAVHEAVARTESADVSVATVVDEFQTGYMIADRLLRPALVRVAMPVGRPAQPTEDEATAD